METFVPVATADTGEVADVGGATETAEFDLVIPAQEEVATASITLQIPAKALVVLIGPSGCGKSTFARRHFGETEVLSSDAFRRLVRDREDALDSKECSQDAFEVLYLVAHKRLAARRLTVVDATNCKREDRMRLVDIAREHNLPAVAVVLNVDYKTCALRNVGRVRRPADSKYIMRQVREMWQNLGGKDAKYLRKEGFKDIFVLTGADNVDAVTKIERIPLLCDRRGERGPFDIIGDLHGCYDELVALLGKLGYAEERGTWVHPEGRRVVFVGDIVDRGPRSIDCLRLVIAMCKAGQALCVPGNHDKKLVRALRGNNVKVAHGLEQTLAEFAALPEAERAETTEHVISFIESLPHHMALAGNKLVVAHAGMPRHLQQRHSGNVWSFALYGETTGEVDEFGLPVRADWARAYDGYATVVYGHTPVVEPAWVNKTLCIDTGCVFGGKLTALRWPEDQIVAVPAARVYSEPVRPLIDPNAPVAGEAVVDDGMLDLPNLDGNTVLQTRLAPTIRITAQQMLCGLETASRQAVSPNWLIYVPPTMSPVETSRRDDYLEHPEDAFEAFERLGATEVVCEAKHMGSRAILIVCRHDGVSPRRFGTAHGEIGVVYTRTGRRFFTNRETEEAVLLNVHAAIGNAGLWDELQTDWLCLDAEVMPWSAKAQDLLRNTYAPTGAAAVNSLMGALQLAEQALANGRDVGEQVERLRVRLDAAKQYDTAWRHYCWNVESSADIKVAPFHVLAAEGQTFFDRDQVWHMQMCDRLAAASVAKTVVHTWWQVVPLDNAAARQAAIAWWEEQTEAGHEGMVVKSRTFVLQNAKGLLQPAVKVRGRKYLRIIYGPEYLLTENLRRLRKRGLGAKRRLALDEFALGVEGLERFARGEPLARVHECALGVLALESEGVDPRL